VGADGGARFAEFVRSRGPALQRTAYLLCGDWAMAEDLLQTSLARAYPRFDRLENPEAYVRRILVNTWSSWWRRKWRSEAPTASVPESAYEPWAEIDSRDLLRGALDRLPRRQRAVVVLRYYEDLSEVEVASLLDVTIGTVKSQNAKALDKLRQDAALTGPGRAPTAERIDG
jgi:RNA polymerase sigma-70 factor (sigma-E family)